MILTKARRRIFLPSVEIFWVAAEDVATLEDALAADEGFAEVVAKEDKVENVTVADLIFEDDPGAAAAARHSALMMVMLSHPPVLGLSVKASYQYHGHSCASSMAEEL